MVSINTVLFLTAILLLLGIGSSKFSARIGMPMLVLFLGVGMLAGSEGLGRIAFENYHLANSIGSVALALILSTAACAPRCIRCVRSGGRP